MYFVKHELYFVKHDAHEQICKNSVTYFFQVEFMVSSYNLPCIPCTMLPVVLHSGTVFRDGSRKNPLACYRKSQGQDDIHKIGITFVLCKRKLSASYVSTYQSWSYWEPFATSIFNLVQDLLSYLESGTSTETFGPETDRLLQKLKPSDHTKQVKDFQAVL